MATEAGRRAEIIVWGKTYPELSTSHRETVCTGGCFVETGTPVRLYPIDLRYLDKHKQYSLYDIIRVPVARSTRDRRPESRKVKSNQLEVVRKVPTGGDWLERHRIIFKDTSWHYDCLDQLKARQQEDKSSLGFVPVREFLGFEVVERSVEEREKHQKKLEHLKSQMEIFAPATKHLDFLPWRFRVRWRCKSPDCRDGHDTLLLDWGLGEMARRDGVDAAISRMEFIGDTKEHDLRFFVGNYKRYQKNFGVVGLWFPKRSKIEAALSQPDLF